MTEYILLAVSLAVTLTYSLMRNSFCKHLPTAHGAIFAFNTAFSASAALVMLVYTLITGGSFSLYTVLFGSLFGIVTAAAAVFNMKAFETGSLSYTSLISTASMIIPALSGALFFDEKVGMWQWVGIALMTVSVLLSVEYVKRSDLSEKRGNLAWFVWSMLMFLAGGGVGVMQKFFRASPDGSQTGAFLTVAFTVAALSSLLLIPLSARVGKSDSPLGLFRDVKFCLYGVLSGVFIAAANLINLYLSGAMDSMIFFPVVNGGGLLLSITAAFVFLHERPGRRRIAGIVLGCISVALLCGIF